MHFDRTAVGHWGWGKTFNVIRQTIHYTGKLMGVSKKLGFT